MINISNKEKCSGCHACASACPKGCVSMKRDEEGFLYPEVNEDFCVNCGLCEKACPIIVKNPYSADVYAYAIKNRNDDIRENSSSGGVFTAIAERILSNGGVVFGAAFDDEFSVRHICVDNVEDLSKLRGSKYLQSTIGDTYKQSKTALDNGKMVYFTGTPCQIEGLLKYLERDYDNLLTSDIICHGVPSPKVWNMYLRSKSASNVKKTTFRNKANGWQTYSMNIEFEDGTVYNKLAKDDLYMKAFLKNLCLRPSCYECSFKSKSRASDLTLADFWGVDYVAPEMNDNKGTSLVLVHTRKGAKAINDISDDIEIQEVDADVALMYNSAAIASVPKPYGRNGFMKKVSPENFENMVEKCSKRTFMQKIKSKIGRILIKIIK